MKIFVYTSITDFITITFQRLCERSMFAVGNITGASEWKKVNIIFFGFEEKSVDGKFRKVEKIN
jgi:hypothetical protein